MGTKISALTTTGSAPADSYIPIAYDGENYKVTPGNVNSVSTAQVGLVTAYVPSINNQSCWSNHPGLCVAYKEGSFGTSRCDIYNCGTETLVHQPAAYKYAASGTASYDLTATLNIVVLQTGKGMSFAMGWDSPAKSTPWRAGTLPQLFFSSSLMGRTADEWVADQSMPTNYIGEDPIAGFPTVYVP